LSWNGAGVKDPSASGIYGGKDTAIPPIYKKNDIENNNEKINANQKSNQSKRKKGNTSRSDLANGGGSNSSVEGGGTSERSENGAIHVEKSIDWAAATDSISEEVVDENEWLSTEDGGEYLLR